MESTAKTRQANAELRDAISARDGTIGRQQAELQQARDELRRAVRRLKEGHRAELGKLNRRFLFAEADSEHAARLGKLPSLTARLEAVVTRDEIASAQPKVELSGAC